MTQTEPNVLSRFGRLGTAFIAYLSLAVGAGLSTAFNVVHTVDVRGDALDQWDIVVAVAGPGMVVLMVELFVSTLWAGQRWYMQAIRWVGCLAVAGIAMRMSWTHGHAFLVSRGQTHDVSALMPLAVDTLAIMATALLLSSRMSQRVPLGPGFVSPALDTSEDKLSRVPGPAPRPGDKLSRVQTYVTEADTYTDTDMMSWTARDTGHDAAPALSTGAGKTDTGQDIRESAAWQAVDSVSQRVPVPAEGDTDTGQDVPVSLDNLDNWMSGLSDRMGQADSVPAVPLSAVRPVGTRAVRPAVQGPIEQDVLDMLSQGVPPAEIKRTLADKHGVSTKTVSRRFPKALGQSLDEA